METSSTTELALQIVGESVDHSIVGVRKITESLPHTTHSNQLSMQRKASKLIAENTENIDLIST